MNPIVKLIEGYLTYSLTDEDRKRLEEIELIEGAADIDDYVYHQMCIMQAISALTTAPTDLIDRIQSLRTQIEKLEETYSAENLPKIRKLNSELEDLYLTDRPVCVSPTIASEMIELNDNSTTDKERAKLKTLIEDVMNTCPVTRKPTKHGTVEKRTTNRDYKNAEARRKTILKALNHHTPFDEAIELIRRAANEYKVPTEVVG